MLPLATEAPAPEFKSKSKPRSRDIPWRSC